MTEVFRLKIVSKRQVTIPQRLLDLLHVEVGDELQIEVNGNQVRAVRPLKVLPADLFTEDVVALLKQRAERIEAGAAIDVTDAAKIFASG